jgi:membrane protease YdiL (CAAX protease family)
MPSAYSLRRMLADVSQMSPGPGRLAATDLLLVVILTLLPVRLLGPLLDVVRSAPDPMASGEAISGGQLMLLNALGIALQSALLIAVVWLFIVRRRGVSWQALGLVPTTSIWVRRGMTYAALAIPLVAVVNLMVQTLLGGPMENPQVDILAPAGFSWSGYVSVLILAGGLAPLVEELAFRGLFYGWLRARLGVAPSCIVSAGAFAVLHGIPTLAPALFVIGLMLAAIYERSGSLWPAIVLHGTFNAVMTTLLYTALAAGMEGL